MMGDDRQKPDFRLNDRTDAEIEAIAKVGVAELSAQGFFFDDVNPVEVAERLARTLSASRDEELRFKRGRYRDLRAVAHRRGRLHLHCERPAFRPPELQSEGARAFGFTTHTNHVDSRIATLLLASVAARDVWLFLADEQALPRAGARAHGRPGLRLTARSPSSGSSSGAATSADRVWIALAVAHPNRATETVPLISGNSTR
jgi:hypothetical protein